mgnify:CR=1 FL=1
MLPRVTRVGHVRDYQLEVHFSDGTIATLDFRDRIAGRGGVFEPLESIESFAQVSVDQESGTLVWPGGVDFCPDVLYAEATGIDIQQLGSELDVV